MFSTKRQARVTTNIEFTRELAEKHAIVKSKQGGWTRVLCRSAEAARLFERMWTVARQQKGAKV